MARPNTFARYIGSLLNRVAITMGTAPTVGQVLTADGSGGASFQTPAATASINDPVQWMMR